MNIPVCPSSILLNPWRIWGGVLYRKFWWWHHLKLASSAKWNKTNQKVPNQMTCHIIIVTFYSQKWISQNSLYFTNSDKYKWRGNCMCVHVCVRVCTCALFIYLETESHCLVLADLSTPCRLGWSETCRDLPVSAFNVLDDRYEPPCPAYSFSCKINMCSVMAITCYLKF